MNEIVVLAKARAKKGSEEGLEKAAREVMAPTHAEPGCLKYSFNRSLEDPSLFVMIECWTTQEALQKHLASPYIQDLFKKLPALLESPMEIATFRTVSGGNSEKGSL